MSEVEASAPRPSVLRRAFDRWVAPAQNPAEVIYGVITVAAVLVTESVHPAGPIHEILATLLVLLVYWLAHSYSSVMGRRFELGRSLEAHEIRAALDQQWSIIRGAGLPLVAMVIAALAGASAFRVDVVGVSVALLVLVGFEVALGARGGLGLRAIVFQALVGVAFGGLIILIRVVLV